MFLFFSSGNARCPVLVQSRTGYAVPGGENRERFTLRLKK